MVLNVTSAIYAREQLKTNVIDFSCATSEEHLAEDIIKAFAGTTFKETSENQKIINKIDQIAKLNPSQKDAFPLLY